MENESQTFLILPLMTTVKGQLDQRTAILMFDDDTHLTNERQNSLHSTKRHILKKLNQHQIVQMAPTQQRPY